MIVKKITATGVICGLLSLGLPAPARAGGLSPYPVASEFTQIANNIQLVISYATLANQYATQIQQYQRQIIDGTILSNQQFGNLSQDLVGLQHVVQGGNSLSYSMANLDSQFSSKFPTYASMPNTSFATRYSTWSQTSMDSTRTALDAAGMQSDQMTTDQQTLDILKQHSVGAQGQLEAAEVGNEIAVQQAQEMMKLRQLMMADMQSKAAFQAQQIAQQDEAAHAASFFNSTHMYDKAR